MESGITFLNYLGNYFPVLVFIVAVFAFAFGTLFLSYWGKPRVASVEKMSPYECGSEPISDARMPFPVRYYIIAMLFVIFDVEIIFLYPWAVVFSEIGFLGFLEMIIFIALFVLAFVYAWRKGALEWD